MNNDLHNHLTYATRFKGKEMFGDLEPYALFKIYILMKWSEDIKVDKKTTSASNGTTGEYYTIDDIRDIIANIDNTETSEFIKKLRDFYKIRTTEYFRTYKYSTINGRLPNKKYSPKLFVYIKNLVMEYRGGKMPDKRKRTIEEIPNWIWEFEHLTLKGTRQYNAIIKTLDEFPLSDREIRILDKVREDYRNEVLPKALRRLYLAVINMG